MILRRGQVEMLERLVFFDRLRRFLLDRVKGKNIRERLAGTASLYGMWNRVLDACGTGPEYRTALLLTYALLSETQGEDPVERTTAIACLPNSEYAAKCYFEDSGVLRFSAFDI